MKVSLIAAVAANGIIGRDGGLPWRLPADLRHFKKTTMGRHLVMGRRTFASTGALPGRTTIVVSRGRPELPAGVLITDSPGAALELARERGEREVFVAGGGDIYAAVLDQADRLYLTRVHSDVEGDTSFPPFDEAQWRLTERRERPADDDHPFDLTFLVYERER